MKRHTHNRFFKQERRRIYTGGPKEPYRDTQKLPDPTVCTGCGALFTEGRWTWNDIPEEANSGQCPACRRVADRYPAGILELGGRFLKEHRTEIVNLVRNTAGRELRDHPLERIMQLREEDGVLSVWTTGMHLARRIGDALFSAYEGDLEYNYDAETLIRVSWNRN